MMPTTYSLYKILFRVKALLWESIILLLPPPAPLVKPTLLQYYCKTIALSSTHLRPPICMPYTIPYCALQYRVKANPTTGSLIARGLVVLRRGQIPDSARRSQHARHTPHHPRLLLCALCLCVCIYMAYVSFIISARRASCTRTTTRTHAIVNEY